MGGAAGDTGFLQESGSGFGIVVPGGDRIFSATVRPRIESWERYTSAIPPPRNSTSLYLPIRQVAEYSCC